MGLQLRAKRYPEDTVQVLQIRTAATPRADYIQTPHLLAELQQRHHRKESKRAEEVYCKNQKTAHHFRNRAISSLPTPPLYLPQNTYAFKDRVDELGYLSAWDAVNFDCFYNSMVAIAARS